MTVRFASKIKLKKLITVIYAKCDNSIKYYIIQNIVVVIMSPAQLKMQPTIHFQS
jgi:hypothetical protein